MFSSFKSKILLGVYIFILLSIPIGAYLTSQNQTIKSSASEQKTPKKYAPVTPKPNLSAAQQLLNESSKLAAGSTPGSTSAPASSSMPAPSSPTIATSFGPTLSLKAVLEGRPANNQAAKLFVGIIEGSVTTSPKFILSFSIDLPASGEYSGLSLAGLAPGSTYTVLLKGPAQIATAQTFVMSPTVSNLKNGAAVSLISGDLNDDNTINNADNAILQLALGARPTSTNWIENADLNKDEVINAFDLAILVQNLGKTGDSGVWTSPVPTPTTTSSLNTSPNNHTGGYWLWLPQ